VDLGHNFVLADSRCNGKKRERLPACDHLAVWTQRNTKCGDQIRKSLEEQGMIFRIGSIKPCRTVGILAGGSGKRFDVAEADDLVPVGAEWRRLFL